MNTIQWLYCYYKPQIIVFINLTYLFRSTVSSSVVIILFLTLIFYLGVQCRVQLLFQCYVDRTPTAYSAISSRGIKGK